MLAVKYARARSSRRNSAIISSYSVNTHSPPAAISISSVSRRSSSASDSGPANAATSSDPT